MILRRLVPSTDTEIPEFTAPLDYNVNGLSSPLAPFTQEQPHRAFADTESPSMDSDILFFEELYRDSLTSPLRLPPELEAEFLAVTQNIKESTNDTIGPFRFPDAWLLEPDFEEFANFKMNYDAEEPVPQKGSSDEK